MVDMIIFQSLRDIIDFNKLYIFIVAEEAIAAYKKAQDEMTTAAILGADWRTKLAEQDKTIIEDYKNGYEGVQNQLNNSVIPMIELANKELDTYSEQIDKLKEQKDLYKDMEDNQKEYLDFYKTYAEQFATATVEQAQAVERLNKAIANNTKLTNMDDTDRAYDWAKSMFDEDYISKYADENGISADLVKKLMETMRNNQTVIDAISQTVPNLLNSKSDELMSAVENTGKSIIDQYNENKNTTWNQTLNINNPGLAMSYDDFVSMINNYWAEMNREAQIGKK